MTRFPYAKAPKKLESFLRDIQRFGKPEKASNKWLKSSGYTSSNDASMLSVLQFIGFLDSSRIPTDAWQSYRDQSKSKHVLANSILHGYSMLFEHSPAAETLSREELTNFFRGKTSLGDSAIERMVSTFQVLCSLADFSVTSANGAGTSSNGKATSTGEGTPLVAPPQSIESPTPTLHIDFQVHIAADAPPEQIDKIFESMAKHLYNKEAE